MLFFYYAIFTSTSYFIRKPRIEREAFSLAVGCSCVLCKNATSTGTCSNPQLLPGLRTEEKALRKALIPSLGFPEVCEHYKRADLLAVVRTQAVHNSTRLVNGRTCHFSISESHFLKRRNKRKEIHVLSVTATGVQSSTLAHWSM